MRQTNTLWHPTTNIGHRNLFAILILNTIASLLRGNFQGITCRFLVNKKNVSKRRSHLLVFIQVIILNNVILTFLTLLKH